ncbi:MAG: hypothetical protein EP147_01550 [Subdoligranulum sp.]|nr:hypothetical protein [Subdoligranulum sp.]
MRSVFAGARPGPPLGAHPVYDCRYRHSLAVPAPERTACLQLAVEFIRQRIYLEKYTLLSGTALFGAFFLICEPVTMPNRTSSRLIYGAALGIATYAFRIFSPYQSAICFALLIVGAIPEWLDLISHRTERIRFMKKEEQRLAKSTKPE